MLLIHTFGNPFQSLCFKVKHCASHFLHTSPLYQHSNKYSWADRTVTTKQTTVCSQKSFAQTHYYHSVRGKSRMQRDIPVMRHQYSDAWGVGSHGHSHTNHWSIKIIQDIIFPLSEIHNTIFMVCTHKTAGTGIQHTSGKWWYKTNDNATALSLLYIMYTCKLRRYNKIIYRLYILNISFSFTWKLNLTFISKR